MRSTEGTSQLFLYATVYTHSLCMSAGILWNHSSQGPLNCDPAKAESYCHLWMV